ncbi:WG repeat-containing protein [uncultured Tenacibaculum sp.]|uniref:WG repeat-containing protein n=1 Tax=uncultured Tenacibaculum sp. TaxID=174713 RepID=UPI003414C210
MVPFKYVQVEDFYNGLAKVINHDFQEGYIDKKGKEVIPLKFDFVPNKFGFDFEGVEYKGKWGVVDRNGNIIIPFKYERCYGFRKNEFSVAKSKGK